MVHTEITKPAVRVVDLILKDVDKDLRDKFKSAVTMNGATMKQTLLDFMAMYVRSYESIPEDLKPFFKVMALKRLWNDDKTARAVFQEMMKSEYDSYLIK